MTKNARWDGVLAVAVAAVAASGLGGCTTNEKVAITKAAIKEMPSHQRDQELEATARVMEEQPEMVEQFYAVARRHPKLMAHLMATASADLENPEMAKMAATAIAENPKALEEVLVTSLDVIAAHPKARAAMNRAMTKKAEVATDILTDNPDTVARVLDAGLVVIEKKPAAKKTVLIAVRKDRAKLLAFAKNDPALMKEMGEEILREAVKDHPALAKVLVTAKILDERGPLEREGRDVAAPPHP